MHNEIFSFQPWRSEFQGYTRSFLKCDFFAGLQVALLTLPQAMAYALIAGLPLSAGLFAAIFSSFVALFFSSSRFLIAGPINAIAIIIQTSVADILYHNYRDLPESAMPYMALTLVVQIAFLVGLFQAIVAVFKLGNLTQFISRPVMSGYLAGSMFAVIFDQIFPFVGLTPDFDSNSLFEKGLLLFTRFDRIELSTLSVGLVSLASLALLRKIDERLPAGLITVVLAAVTVYFFNETILSDRLKGVALVGNTSEAASLLPEFGWPEFNFKLMNQLVPISFAIALFGILETSFTIKAVARRAGQRLSINQEILSLGLGNIFSSFTFAMPIAYSSVRSALNLHSGAKTRLAGLFSVLLVAALVTLFSFFVDLVPLTTFSAIIFLTAFKIINIKETLLCFKATPQDRFVLLTTFIACLFFSLDVAFYIGVILSIGTYLKKAALPHVGEYAIHDSGELRTLGPSGQLESKPIRLIKVEGELFFGAAEAFENSLKAIVERDLETKVIILQLKNARDIDATACLALSDLYDSLKLAGCHLLIAGLTYPIWEVLSISGIVEKIGKENLFIFDDMNPHHYMKKALERAKRLLHEPLSSERREPLATLQKIVQTG
jgi:SulP family sulfate permease